MGAAFSCCRRPRAQAPATDAGPGKPRTSASASTEAPAQSPDGFDADALEGVLVDALSAQAEAGAQGPGPAPGAPKTGPSDEKTGSDVELEQAVYEAPDFSWNGERRLAKPVDVYDGDTLRLKFRIFGPGSRIVQCKVRMAGFDSPEILPPRSSPNREAEIKAAVAARDALAVQLGGRVLSQAGHKKTRFEGGRLVTAEFGPNDKYGRPLVTLYTPEGLNLNRWMIDEGHGYVYGGGTKKAFGA